MKLIYFSFRHRHRQKELNNFQNDNITAPQGGRSGVCEAIFVMITVDLTVFPQDRASDVVQDGLHSPAVNGRRVVVIGQNDAGGMQAEANGARDGLWIRRIIVVDHVDAAVECRARAGHEEAAPGGRRQQRRGHLCD